VAVLVGLVAVAVVPAAVAVAERTTRFALVDAAWAAPAAALLGILAIAFARGARGKIDWTLGRARGRSRARLGKTLGVLAICVALSAGIAIAVYHGLLYLQG
jgi:hypothetical protein